MHFTYEQILAARTETESTRAWTLWLLLPRLLLHRPPGTRTLPKEEWRKRLLAFQQGEWQHILGTIAPGETSTGPAPPTAQHHTNPECRTQRARHLVHQGELSAARQALTATPPAPGTAATLPQLQDPARRPAEPYTANQPAIQQFVPDQPLQLPAQSLSFAAIQERGGTRTFRVSQQTRCDWSGMMKRQPPCS